MAKRKSNKITQHRQELAEAIADGNKVVEVAGYHSGNLNAALATPQMVRAIKAGLTRRLITEAVPAAMKLLQRAVKAGHDAYDAGSYATPAQLDAAKSLMGFGGMQAAGEALSIDKDPGEMTGAELEEALRKADDIRAELGRRQAVTVDGRVSAPGDAPEDGQAVDPRDILFS